MTEIKFYVVQASSLSTHTDCPRKWAVHYLDRARGAKSKKDGDKKEAQNIGALIGDICHHAAQRFNMAKVDGEVVSLSTVTQAALAEYQDTVNNTPITYDDATRDKRDGGLQIARMIEIYYTDVLPGINPYWVEAEIETQYSHLLRLRPRLDVLATISAGAYWLIDLKFGRRDASHAEQLGCNLTAIEEDFKRLAMTAQVSRVSVIHIPRAGLKSNQPPPVFQEYTRDQVIDAYEMSMEDLEREIRESEESESLWPFRPRPQSNLCSKQYCEAWGTSKCNQWREK